MMSQITTRDESNNYTWNHMMSQIITRLSNSVESYSEWSFCRLYHSGNKLQFCDSVWFIYYQTNTMNMLSLIFIAIAEKTVYMYTCPSTRTYYYTFCNCNPTSFCFYSIIDNVALFDQIIDLCQWVIGYLLTQKRRNSLFLIPSRFVYNSVSPRI